MATAQHVLQCALVGLAGFITKRLDKLQILARTARSERGPIATLCGFLARKGDGEPGVKTIWLGLQRVMDAATTSQVLRNPVAMGCV